MMTHERGWLVAGLCLLAVLTLRAQEVPDYGKVPQAELDMTTSPGDAGSAAVCLFNVAEARMERRDKGFRVSTTHRVRIKVLGEEGKAAADVRIQHWHEDLVYDVEAYSVGPDGQKSKLKGGDVHREPGDWFKAVQFSIPGVQVGSVLEYRYSVSTRHVRSLDPWEFRGPWPTRLSRFSMVMLPGFRYNIYLRNMPDIPPDTRPERLLDGSVGQRMTWSATMLPPLRPEPHMLSVADQRSSLLVELVSYEDGYQFVKLSSSWADIVEQLQEREQAFDKLGRRELDEILVAACTDCPTARDSVEALHRHVSRMVSTHRGLFGVQGPQKALVKESRGTEIEKNTLLRDLLVHAGLPARILLISTRSHGAIWENMISDQQLDHCLVQLDLGDETLLLDTSTAFHPMSLLPEDLLAQRALPLDEPRGRFVALPSPTTLSMRHASTEAWLDSLGDLRASSQLRLETYQAVGIREALASRSGREVAQDILDLGLGHAECDSFHIDGRDETSTPLVVTLHYHVPGFAQRAGDRLFLPQLALHRISAHPFPDPKRLFPVEFSTPRGWSDDWTLHLPDGWEIADPPVPSRLQFGGLKRISTVEAQPGLVHAQRQFIRTQLRYTPSEYEGLRQFYDHSLAADQVGVTLRKTVAHP